MNIVFDYMDTRSNGEDFALTPYLALVYCWKHIPNVLISKNIGLCVCWGWWAVAFYFSFGLGNRLPFFVTRKTLMNEKKR